MLERNVAGRGHSELRQNIVDTCATAAVLDVTLLSGPRIVPSNQTFHVSPGDRGRLIYGAGQWPVGHPNCDLLEDIVPKSSVFDDFELDHTFPVIGHRVMLLNARKLQAGHHGEMLVLAM